MSRPSTCINARHPSQNSERQESLRIGIDVSVLSWKRSGARRILLNILTELPQLDVSNSYVLYANKETDDLRPFRKYFVIRIVPSPKIIFSLIILPLLTLLDRIAVLYIPTPDNSIFKTCKTIITIHDIAYEEHPNWFKPTIRLGAKLKFYYTSAHLADAVVAVSNYTKKAIMQSYHIPAAKITVITPAADRAFCFNQNAYDKKSLSASLGIQFPYILYMDTVRTSNLIRAFHILKSKYRIPHHLVMVGKFDSRLQETINFYGISEDVMILSKYLPDSQLSILYRYADVFVFPSYYEGFGLPVIEAMSCGAPVIASSHTALPEVVSGAGVLVNPNDPEQIANEIQCVLNDSVYRSELSRRALCRSKDFSWEKSVYKLVKLIRDISKTIFRKN